MWSRLNIPDQRNESHHTGLRYFLDFLNLKYFVERSAGKMNSKTTGNSYHPFIDTFFCLVD
jgi:hypothetical protein